MRRSLIVFAVAALMAATAAPAAARPLGSPLTVTPLTATRMIQANKSVSGQLARSDADLLARRDRAVVNVMVKMDVDALASYAGDVAGFRATSPGVTGRTLNDNSGAVGSYQRYLEGKAFGIRRAAQRVVPGMRLGRNFLVAFGGFAAQLPANRARDLLKVKGVAAVQYDTVSYPTANDSPDFVGATALWPSLGGSATAGEGIKVGVIDTGIWPEHPMLLDPGINAPPGGPYGCEFGDGIDPDFGDDFTCNDKMLGAYAFLETNLFVSDAADGNFCNDANTECSARDPDGHGTHTSTTAVGSHVASAVLYGVERGPISGIAPGASLIHYRVCLDGCYSSDSIDAVEQAILDDVDVINFSISGGANPYSDSVELAFLDAYAAGILVNASAGNDGPDAGTANHGGPWVNTVGASTLDREFGSMVSLVADNLDTLDVSGVTITAGVTSAPVVLGSASTSGEICDTPAGGGDYTGVVVVCKRGGIARVEKGYNISLGGAAGMILYNTTATDLETDNHWVPAIHVNDPSETIAAFVAGHTGVMATWSAGVAGPTLGDMMASFSSRGPLGDFIKPDVTAPGVQILAGNSPDLLFDPAGGLGPDGELYQAIAGTSMSSPHAAGVAALLKDAHPSWTPGQIKSAMMTSSRQSVVKEDGSTPADPFDMGAGSIRANRANTPTVTFDVSAAQYFASAGDPFSRIHLNTPSINAPTMSGKITTTRTVQNATGVAQTLNASATAPAGSKITVTPSSISLTPWGFATFSVTIDGQKLADGQYFGLITLDPVAGAYRNAVLPVAFYKQPGDVTLENSCATPPTLVADEETILKGDELDCEVTVTNYASADAHVQVRVRAPNTGRLIVNDWSAGNKKGNGFLWNGTLSPALAPDILSIDAPGYGYFSLPSLGVPPEAGYGDETIGTYEGLDPFTFGGEVYDALGIDSNGYVVLGGGLGVEDNNCCDPLMPDPARPNNVLAPYWTDLDPGSGGDIYFAELDFGGGFVYYVIEWRKVPVWGTSDERTFQVWIAQTTAPEDIAFEYCIAPNDDLYPTSLGCDDAAPGTLGPGASDGLVVGAENRDGTSAATIGPEDTEPSNSGYVVDAGEPTAGGTYTIMYQAWGKKTGTFLMRALMTSDVTQGTAIQIVKVHVVNP